MIRITPSQKMLLHKAAQPDGAPTSAFASTTLRSLVKAGLVRLDWRPALRVGPPGTRPVPVRVAYITNEGRSAMEQKAHDTKQPRLRDEVVRMRSEAEGLRQQLAAVTATNWLLANILAEAERTVVIADVALSRRIRSALALAGISPDAEKRRPAESDGPGGRGGARPPVRAPAPKWKLPLLYRSRWIGDEPERWLEVLDRTGGSVGVWDTRETGWRQRMRSTVDAHVGGVLA